MSSTGGPSVSEKYALLVTIDLMKELQTENVALKAEIEKEKEKLRKSLKENGDYICLVAEFKEYIKQGKNRFL